MKILKYGEGYPKTTTCELCDSKLEYEFNDIYEYSDIYTDRTEHFKQIKCPVCGFAITVDICIREYNNQEKKRWWQL